MGNPRMNGVVVSGVNGAGVVLRAREFFLGEYVETLHTGRIGVVVAKNGGAVRVAFSDESKTLHPSVLLRAGR